jgi:L-fuconate dehydratase
MLRIEGLEIIDVRFPTSAKLDGSDAMNPDPDYSAAYVVLRTNRPEVCGHGLTFTIGRGNELCCAAIGALERRVIGLELDWIREDPGRFWRHMVSDSQLRWIGPEKGVIHLATGALVNAVWDLWSRAVAKPVWQLLADMAPEELVRIVDFRYITDALTPEEALGILKRAVPGKAERLERLQKSGYPCYTTSAGWLGYDDARLKRACREAVEAGFRHLKFKVGSDLNDDVRRLGVVRDAIGAQRSLLLDANQVWEVDQAIAWMDRLRFANPYFIEEPTSPDDVEGHRRIREAVAPIRVATGEVCQNRVLFKQFLMRDAIDVAQLDACRLGGLNEVLAVMLLCAKYRCPIWPHAGGVGLGEYVQHLSAIDYLCVSGEIEGRVVEYVDNLHEHMVHPCIVQNAAYRLPREPGFSIEMREESLRRYRFST